MQRSTQVIRVAAGVYRRAKVAAAEAGEPLGTFCDRALDIAVRVHEAKKRQTVQTVPVEVVARGGVDGRG